MYVYCAYTGIVPIFCETLFKEVDEKRSEGSATEFQVFQFSDIHIFWELCAGGYTTQLTRGNCN